VLAATGFLFHSGARGWTSDLQCGRNRPAGDDLMRCVGDFVTYEIWGAISVTRGPFIQVKTLKF